MAVSLDPSLYLGVISGCIYPFLFWIIHRQEGTFKAISNLDRRMDLMEKRTACLITLHSTHHPEDKGTIAEACGVPA